MKRLYLRKRDNRVSDMTSDRCPTCGGLSPTDYAMGTLMVDFRLCKCMVMWVAERIYGANALPDRKQLIERLYQITTQTTTNNKPIG